jgi:hypothetical protein
MAASFAMTADEWVLGAPQQAKAEHKDLRSRFAAPANRAANDQKTKKSSGGDSIFGGLVVDMMFSTLCPGLGNVFNGLSMLDTVDLYDELRPEFTRTPHGHKHAPVTRVIVPPRKSLFAMLFE